ncbi:hypothetical protein BCON_0026g00120 [Botryotinia convoluta]|uniref:Uncharacterized protein n=1 Tax=Botryotinia convoluta TaxID=54673 RepID=A0A4Z1IJG2_9HELO|nr:hypothetical protein BCON_0026g00120 [Botryotinia convoluta]
MALDPVFVSRERADNFDYLFQAQLKRTQSILQGGYMTPLNAHSIPLYSGGYTQAKLGIESITLMAGYKLTNGAAESCAEDRR